MKIASVADVKARLSAYVKESQEGPVVVTRNGKAIAVLLAVTDEDELERLVLAHLFCLSRNWNLPSRELAAILSRRNTHAPATSSLSS
jgi:prevent-host-death family protein